jgi:O-antigen/teichoic acid export membrane protein
MTEATVQNGSLPAVDLDLPVSANSEMRPQRKIGARDFAWTFGTNITIQLCTIVQAIFLARLLGPTGRGQFAAATLWPSVFASVGGLGVAIALAQRSARAQELGRISRTALILTLFTASIATLVCAASLPLLMANVDAVSRTTTWYFLPYILFNHVALG